MATLVLSAIAAPGAAALRNGGPDPVEPGSPAAVVGRYGLPDWFPLRGSHTLGCTNGNGCAAGYHGYWALDIQANKGDAVFAAGAGQVVARQTGQGSNCDAATHASTASCPDGSRGNWVLVEHLGGVQSFSMHLTDVYVSVGDWVDELSPIGTTGDSGRSTPGFFHLHYEERSPERSVAPRSLAGCLGGVRVSYPSAAHATSWAELAAFGVALRSDGVGCGANPYRPLTPRRLLDTRLGLGVASAGPVAADRVVTLAPGATDGSVPDTATTVVLNVTAVLPSGSGWVTVWPCGETKPSASNVSFSAGRTSPNLVVVRRGTRGQVCLAASRAVHLLADLAGYQPTGSTFAPTAPERLLDTRVGLGAAPRRLAGQEVLRLTVAGRGGANVAPDAAAAILNLTVVDPSSAGWLTAWPCDQPRPDASNLNFSAGQTVANLAVAKLAAGGVVCLVATSSTHVLADIAGWYPSSSSDVAVAPVRVLDTRLGLGAPSGPWPAGAVLSLALAGRGMPAVPADAHSAILNLTAVGPDRAGHATVWPCNEPRPDTSNLNFERGDIVANLVSVKLAPGTTLCVTATASLHLVADLAGWTP